MDIGIITSLKVENLNNVFERAASVNIHTVQLGCWNTDLMTQENAENILKQAKENNMTLCALWAGYCPPRKWNFTEGPTTLGLVPQTWRNQRVADLKKGADWAKMLHVKTIITHCGFLPENMTDYTYRPIVEAIREIATYCKEVGVDFLFETGQETPVVLLRVIQELGLDNVGVNLDPANLILYGKGNPIDALDVFGQYVRMVHVKDGLYPTDGNSLGKEVQVGKGKVNFPVFLKRLKEIGYNGTFVIEREIKDGTEKNADILETVQNLHTWWE